MALQNGTKAPLHLFGACDFVERPGRQLTNYAFDEGIIRISFDHLHQLQRRLFQFNALRRRFIKRAVDDVRPVDQFLERGIVKGELFPRHTRNKFRAGFAVNVEKLSTGTVGVKVRFVFRLKERRFMMIEPPGELVRGRILEIDDGILVSVKHVFVEQVAGTMQQPLILHFGFGTNQLFIKPGKGCG